MLAISQRLGKCVIPREACIIRLSENRKRGRPTLTVKALQKQPIDFQEPEDLPEVQQESARSSRNGRSSIPKKEVHWFFRIQIKNKE